MQVLAQNMESRMSDQVRPVINVSRTYKNGSVLTKEESEELPGMDIRQFPTGVTLGSVTVGTRITKNLGNYETCQQYVEVTFPCLLEEVNEAYDAAQVFVEKKIMESVQVIEHYRNSK